MTKAAQAFGREAFEFIENLDRQPNPDAVIQAMSRAVGRFGFEGLFVSWLRAPSNQPFDDVVLAAHALPSSEPSTPAGATSDSIPTFGVPLARTGLLNGICRPVKAGSAAFVR
jgi:hypothetical protein